MNVAEDRSGFYKDENISKEKLQEIESQIKEYIGHNPDNIRLWLLNQKEMSELDDLFGKRCWILNNLFEETPENMERFRQVNSHLRYLSQKLHERIDALDKKAGIICDDADFDDDYELEGTLKYSYNGEDSVLKLSDDNFYGSDFNLMISALDSFYYYNKDNYEILRVRVNSLNMDDGMNWNETLISFPDIEICYASHELVSHKHFSLPDYIRLNDFWTEVKFIEQSITEQNGARWKDPHSNLERIKNEG